MAPRWVAGEPEWLPPEFYWLVGVAHRGFPKDEREVRNTFGSNISFKRDVFEGLPGYAIETVRDRSVTSAKKRLFAVVLTAAVGLGFFYALVT